MSGEKLDILGLSVTESISNHSIMVTKIKEVLITKKTKYQDVQIVEFHDFGRGLILDGLIQSTEADEYIYHESLVQPVMVTHPKPEKVLIIGGGEGATLREVLKHENTISEAVMVDIDGELIELAKKYLEFMHQGSFNHPKAKVVISDGKEYVRNTPSEYFDVVILDLTDPYGPEIARELYSKEFYSEVKRILKSDGIMVTQAGSSFFYPKVYRYVLENIKANFPIVREYWVWVPSYGYSCNFIIGSLKYDPKTLSVTDVEKVLESRGVKDKLRLYCGEFHEALFKFPIIIRTTDKV